MYTKIISAFAIAFLGISTYMFSSEPVNFRELTNHSLVTIGSYCSGVIVDDQLDLIATAGHCAGSGLPTENIMITQDYYDVDGNKTATYRYFAKLVKPDADHDVAILQVTNGDIPTGDAIKIADEPVEVGDRVYSLGNPLMLPHLVTEGIVAKKFSKEVMGREWIVSDVITDHGSSGGALVNANGELIGINDVILGMKFNGAIWASAQWSGASPVKYVSKLIKDIKEYKL